jgi:hypothetical protein
LRGRKVIVENNHADFVFEQHEFQLFNLSFADNGFGIGAVKLLINFFDNFRAGSLGKRIKLFEVFKSKLTIGTFFSDCTNFKNTKKKREKLEVKWLF